MIDPASHLEVLAALTLGVGAVMVRLGLDRGLLQPSRADEGSVRLHLRRRGALERVRIRRDRSHLFLRYELPPPGQVGA